MASACAAYVLFHCSSRELQARAGFDGWVMLLRDQFDTEDQAWPQEQLRLASIAKRKMRRLEAGGVELDMLQLVTSCHLLLEPPQPDREEERIWCIEYFRGKMYDFVVRLATRIQRRLPGVSLVVSITGRSASSMFRPGCQPPCNHPRTLRTRARPTRCFESHTA